MEARAETALRGFPPLKQVFKTAGLALGLLLLTGCSSNSYHSFQSGAAAEAKTLQVVAPAPASSTTATKLLKLKLTLDSPKDLKVAQGDFVYPGQILGDRSSERSRLEQQKRLLNAKLTGLQDVKVYAPKSDADERANVAAAQQVLGEARAAIARYKKLSPWTEYAQNKLAIRDEAQINLEANLQQAKQNLALAQGKLAAAQAESLIVKDTSAEQAQVLSQLQTLDQQLTQLAGVRSPYSGTVKTIKWLGQTDRELQVELSLAVSETAPSPVAQPVPSAEPRLKQVSKTAPALPESTLASSAQTWSVVPKLVHDGDTIRVQRQGQALRIRFCGIDAPELKQPQGEQARNYLRSLLNQSGNQVQITQIESDRFGRTVAEVFRAQQGQMVNVNAEMTRAGWAYYYARYASHCPHHQTISFGEQQAKQQRLGVWANPTAIKPWEWRAKNR